MFSDKPRGAFKVGDQCDHIAIIQSLVFYSKKIYPVA